MSEIKRALMEKKLSTLRLKLLGNGFFIPELGNILFKLEILRDTSQKLLATDSSYYPVIQDLLIYLEVAHEAIDDAMKDIDSLNQEVKR